MGGSLIEKLLLQLVPRCVLSSFLMTDKDEIDELKPILRRPALQRRRDTAWDVLFVLSEEGQPTPSCIVPSRINSFTVIPAAPSLGKQPTEVPNLKH